MDAEAKEVHDFNNRLSILLGLLCMARELAGAAGQLAEVLTEAEKVARKLGPSRPSLWIRRAVPPVLAALLAFLYTPAWGGGFKGLAKELSRGARQAGISRVAVLPFEPVAGGASREGWRISEDLTTQFVRAGRIQTVERSLLKKLMDEHSLARTGLMEASSVKKLGAVFAVDGIVSGSFVTLGRHVKVNARLIQVETGLIVAACEAEADRELFDLSGLSEDPVRGMLSYIYVPAPRLDVEPPSEFPVALPRLFPEDGSELRDAPADDSCAGAAARVDRMESMILELKARYWALRLKKGLAAASLKQNPGSTITDPELKRRFYGLVKSWYERGWVPELTPDEVRRFVAIDRRAFALHRECGL
jgi:TolB-like protein